MVFLPKISVAIPTFNRKEKLKCALEPLFNQTYPKNKYEIIVVDDGSTDGINDLLKHFQKKFSNLIYLKQNHRGPAAARNLGIKKSTGEIIFFTDDDCIVPRNWIEKFVRVYQKYPGVAGVGGYLEADEYTLKTNIFARYESYIARIAYRTDRGEYLGGFECPAGGTANISYRKNILEEVGGFDETYPVAAGEDADLKLRICLKGYKLAYVPVKVTHIQDYGMQRFVKQNIVRGAGESYFSKKWSKVLGEKGKKAQYGAALDIIPLLKMLKELRPGMLCLFFLSSLVKLEGRWKEKLTMSFTVIKPRRNVDNFVSQKI